AKIERGIAGLPTAFRATFGSGVPRVALFAEYDALPNIGHACGHNVSGTASVFAAIALVESGLLATPSRSPSCPSRARDLVSLEEGEKVAMGTLEVIGTPMEEVSGGKIAMLDAGAFNGIDVVLMAHTSNETRISYRTVASQAFRIILTADPKEWHWRSRNIMDVLLDVLMVLRTTENRAGVGTSIMSAIPEGGTQNNVVPARVAVDVGIWCYDEDVLARVIERIQGGVRQEVANTKVAVAFDMYERKYLPLEPNETLVAAFERNLKVLDIPFEPRQGRLYDSVDIGNVSHVIPTLHADIFLHASRTHTPEHATAAGGPEGEAFLRTAMKGLALTTFDLLRDPDDIVRAKRELAERKQPKELKPGRLP
ncbi:MAG: hypothetical protein V1723_00710, partial [Candidatus Uhrbacteria bacterium]